MTVGFDYYRYHVATPIFLFTPPAKLNIQIAAMDFRTIFSSIAGGHIDNLREDIFCRRFPLRQKFQREKSVQEIERLLWRPTAYTIRPRNIQNHDGPHSARILGPDAVVTVLP